MRCVKYNYRLFTKEIIEDGKVIPFDQIIERLNELDKLKERLMPTMLPMQRDMCIRCECEEAEDGALCWKCSINRALN